MMDTTTKDPLLTRADRDVTPTTSTIDQALIVGYVLIAVSFSLFTWEFLNTKDAFTDFFRAFLVHYVVAIGYAIYLILDRSFGIRKSWRKPNIHKNVLLLNLFLISAFALNREFTVFYESTTWLSVLIVVTSVNAMTFAYYESMPRFINTIQLMVLGVSVALYGYFFFYTLPFLPISGIAIIFFGFGGLMFLPFLFLVSAISLRPAADRKKPKVYMPVLFGFALAIFFSIGFIVEWNQRVERIETLANQSVIFKDSGLPIWAKVGQSLRNDWITERILKSKLSYNIVRRGGAFSFPDGMSWSETKKHDPLVYLASISSNANLTNEERVKILQAIRDGRHNSNERLWNGDNLKTAYVITDVDLYPDLRLAYTEKYVNVANTSSGQSWRGDTQEAIYTFYLPEGSVITSLSLWIGGKEEKAILTSKQKASNAYKTIVGVEARDPSIVHWQEGNTVTVRVFPCTPDEERKFKIGITSPLRENSGRLIYDNATFQGPSFADATETVRLRVVGQETENNFSGFRQDSHGDFVKERTYDEELSLSIPSVPLDNNRAFWFDGFAYSINRFIPTLKPASIKSIYIDVNKSWTDEEVEWFESMKDRYSIFVEGQSGFVKLDESTDKILQDARSRNFTLFPFFGIENIEDAIVITKGTRLSPHLSDLPGSAFAERITNLFASGNKVKVFNLGDTASTYIRSLREFRALQYASGSIDDFDNLVQTQQYPFIDENADKVVLHDARLEISRTATNQPEKHTAPDHLVRLFAYNSILSQVGTNYLRKDFVNDDLVRQAQQAYVVSPVSSLIVLETKDDYERFGIKDAENSLKNAVKNESGAVPEPHEWILIALFAGIVVYLKLRKN